MPINIPDLTISKSERIVACGSVENADGAVVNFLKQRTHMISSIKKGGEKHYLLLMSGGPKNNHFHLEVALEKRFPAKNLPVANTKVSELQEVASRFLGTKLNLNFKCDLPVPFDELPESSLIRLLSIDVKLAGTRVKLTQGNLSVSGSRIQNISWSQRKRDRKIIVSLDSSYSQIVNADYLIEGQLQIESYFRTLVLGMPAPTEL